MTKNGVDPKQLIKTGESQTIALLKPDVPENLIIDTLLALANCSGGTILLGIENDEIIGVKDAQKRSNQIMDLALAITPRLIIGMPDIQTISGKSLISVTIPAGLPHVYAYQGRYLQRSGTENQPLSPIQLRQLMMKRGEYSFEAEVAHQTNLDDINWQQAEDYTKNLSGMSQYSTKEILYQRGCLIKQDEQYIPTNAGILIFGKDPQQFIRGSEITAVRFAGKTMSDTFSRQDITGTLPQQIQKAETFLIDHLRKSVQLKDKMQREEDYEYPMEAVRELIVNAVAHRDYSIQGDNIRLFMYSDFMEVHSPGSLPGPMTLDNLKDERFSRNPIIVQILSDMGYIERLGYGVDRVIQLMESKGYKSPQFTNNASGFKVSLSGSTTSTDDKKDKLSEDNKKDDVTEHFNGIYQGNEINPRQESALVYLHKDTHSRITNSDLKSMFPDVHPETIRRDLVDLVNKDILKKMGQKRGSYYILNTVTASNDK